MLVRSRSDRASDEVARGRLVSLEGFSFTFRAKNEEWRDLQLVSQITFGRNSDQSNRTCLRFSCASTDQIGICLLFTNKNIKRKLTSGQKKTKACFNLELIAGKEIASGVTFDKHSCRNCSDLISFAAVFRLVTQRSSPQTAVCGEERCVTSLKTAAKETSSD